MKKDRKMMKSNIKLVIFIPILLIIFSCNNQSKIEQSFEVKFEGALKNIMHKGDLSAKVNLSEYEHTKNLYGLGAIENLKGEIQIFNGQPINSSVENGIIEFDSSYSKSATLFVHAVVEKWVSFPIPNKIVSTKELEKYLEKTASENNIDINQPFPFLIDGTAKELSWHVINWKDGDTEHSHEKHISSGLNDTIENEEVKMLGFYSNSHHAIFTHHTTNMHIHMKLANSQIAGHIDELKLGQNMILKLPENK
jgi:hypothetical protein